MQTTDFVSSYFDAWNRHDSKAIADHLSESGTYLDMAFHKHFSRPQLVCALEEDFEHEDNKYELFGEVLARNNTIAFQYRVLPNKHCNDPIANHIWYGAEFVTLNSEGAVKIADYYEVRDLEFTSQLVSQIRPDSVANSMADISTEADERANRYLKSGLDSRQLELLKSRLSQRMDVEKVYRKPDLSLPELADLVGCSVNHLSQVINAGFGVNFFDFVNQHRVKEAQHRLLPGGGKDQTVLDIALEVGFRSTSTFYVAFRKFTSKTPAQFRKSSLLQQPSNDT